MIYGCKANYKDVCRELLPYESNLRCLKSIKYDPRKKNSVFQSNILSQQKQSVKKNQHFFRSIDREKGRTYIPKVEEYTDCAVVEEVKENNIEKPVHH